jgi:hypothetical protein
MHWTALLAYRRFPADALVIDDVACIGCGYNLRGIRATGRCPECGEYVGDSLFLLARPAVVARALRGIAKSYLACFALLANCLSGTPAWTLIVAVGIIAFGAFWRIVSTAELKYRGAIARLPVIGSRLNLFWIIALVEFIASLMWLIAIIAVAQVPALQTNSGYRMIAMAAAVWMVSLILSAAAAGSLGLALADALAYSWMVIELKVQRIALVVWALAAALLFAVGIASVGRGPSIAALIAFDMVFALNLILCTISLLHVANGAEQEGDPWEEAVGSPEELSG